MKRIIHIALCILTLSGFLSCTDWLGVEPEDGVIREKFWKTKEEAHSALMGCYASLMEDDVMLRYFIWGELRADFIEPTSTSRADEHIRAIRNAEITPSNKYSQWSYFYKTINQCNTVIELAPLAKEKDLSFSGELLKQYVAEATCIRSLTYFYLLRTFRDVPYVKEASIYDDQNYSVPKSSQAEILENLVADLLEIEEGLPFSYNDNATSKGRFTRWGLKALLADIYLWKGDYAECNILCTQIYESGKYSLVPVRRDLGEVETADGKETVYYANISDISTLFNEIYVKGNSVESILELQFGTDKSNPFANYMAPVTGAFIAKTSEIRGEYFPTSNLDKGWYDIRPEFAWKQESLWKQIGLSATGAEYRTTTNSFCNWIYYRLPDIMLMKAEALTQLALAENNDQVKLQEAYKFVKEVRDRANATDATSYEEIYGEELTAVSMEEFILKERARELAFEGKRWFDILRYVERDNYRNLEYLINTAVRCTAADRVSILQNIWRNGKGSHYMPIYYTEVGGDEGSSGVNKNLYQNEFYK